jgi:hypothetical protein
MDRNTIKDIKRDDSKDWSSQQYPQSSPPTNLGADDMKCRELTGSHEASETEKRRSPTLGFLENDLELQRPLSFICSDFPKH